MMDMSYESSGDEAGGSGVSRENGDDPTDVSSVSHNPSGDTADLEGEEKTGPPIAARSTV